MTEGLEQQHKRKKIYHGIRRKLDLMSIEYEQKHLLHSTWLRPPSHAASEKPKLHAPAVAMNAADLNQDVNNTACHLWRARERKPHESRCEAGSLAAVEAAFWHSHVTSSPPMRNQQCLLILTQCGWVDLSNHRGILLFQEDLMFAHYFNSAHSSSTPSPFYPTAPSRQIENDPQEFALYCVHQSGGQCVHLRHHQ